MRFFGGHFTFDMIQEEFADATWLVFLRDPIERIVSNYFNVTNPQRFQHQWVARNDEQPEVKDFLRRIEGISLEDFVFMDDPRIKDRIINRQTRYLVPREELRERGLLYTPYDEWVLAQAKKNLRERFAFVAVQEEFDLAMHLFALTFGMRPFGDLSAYTNNVNAKGSFRKRYEMPDHVRAHLVELNRMDLELWAYGRKLMHERLAAFRTSMLEEQAASSSPRAVAAQPFGGKRWKLADGLRTYGLHRTESDRLRRSFAWTGRQNPSIVEFAADFVPGQRFELCLHALSAIDEDVRDGLSLEFDGQPVTDLRCEKKLTGLFYRGEVSARPDAPRSWHSLKIFGERKLEPEGIEHRRPLGVAFHSLELKPLKDS